MDFAADTKLFFSDSDQTVTFKKAGLADKAALVIDLYINSEVYPLDSQHENNHSFLLVQSGKLAGVDYSWTAAYDGIDYEIVGLEPDGKGITRVILQVDAP
jgi:hypothetical protein